MRAIEILAENDSPVQLSRNAAAKAWIEKVYDLYPGTWQNNHVMTWGEGDDQQFAMFELTPSLSKKDAVEVKWFQAYPLRQGVGSRAMKELQKLAKEDGIALTLYPWDKGQVSQAKLMKFYKGQGFKPAQAKSKNMVWDPNIDEAAVNPAVDKHFKKAGYSKIGSGADANVYAKDEHNVIKILMPEEPGGEAERVFQSFYEFAQKYKSIPNLPRFKPVEKLTVGGEEYTMVGMERLQPLSPGSFEEAMVWQLSDLATKKIDWNQAQKLIRSPEEWEHYSGNISVEQILKTVDSLTPAQLAEYEMLFTLMTLLYYTGRINKIGWDLHTENVMQRRDGRLVVIDPWFAMNEEHA